MGVTGYISRNQNGTLGYFERDGHGDIVNVYGANGTTLLANYTYDAFGNQKAKSGTWAETNPIRYCGEYYDTESGLIYLRARYYESESGRFLTEDPAKDGYNWYSYCAGNPVNRIDPTGLDYEDIEEKEKQAWSDLVEKTIKEFAYEILNVSFINDVKTVADYTNFVKNDGPGIAEKYFVTIALTHLKNVFYADKNRGFVNLPILSQNPDIQNYSSHIQKVRGELITVVDNGAINGVGVEIFDENFNDISNEVKGQMLAEMEIWDQQAHIILTKITLMDLVKSGMGVAFPF